MNTISATKKPVGYAILLIVTGIIGLLSSFQLTLDKMAKIEDPDAVLSCNFGETVQCGKNLDSWQGEIFGFPNPIIGLFAFMVPVVIGFAILAGAKFAKWFWWGFNLGVTLGFIWVIWFAYQSIFVIFSLCPWCMTMWSAMIPMFWTTVIYSAKTGKFGGSEKLRKSFSELYSWTWVIVFFNFLIIGVTAFFYLDLINNF